MDISLKKLITRGQFTLYSALTEKFTFFILFVYLARKTSVENYGTIVAVFAFANILANFFEFGFGPYFQREAAHNNVNLNEELKTAISFKLSSFPFFIAIIIIYFLFSNFNDIVTLVIIGTTIFILFINSIFTSILYGRNLYSNSFSALFLSRILIILLIIISFLFFHSEKFVLLVLLTGGLLQGYLLIYCLHSLNIIITPGKIYGRTLKKIISSSLPIGIGISFVFVYDKIDVLLIEKIINPEAVAVYAVAYSIYKLPQIFSSVLLSPLFSDFSNAFIDKSKFSIKIIAKPAIAFVIISLIIMIGINLTSGFILEIIYGAKYVNSAWILNMLCIALPGLFLDELTGTTLFSLRKERTVMYSRFFAVIINVSINLLLLNRMGILGAIIATIAAVYSSYIIQLLVLLKIKIHLEGDLDSVNV
ncbi:MAG: oligosaccharide flippase family protein [Ignavibacteriaceae bacterium]